MNEDTKTEEPKTSPVKTDRHSQFCNPCGVYHEKGKACPLCGRSLLLD